jgi:hypothetical protein
MTASDFKEGIAHYYINPLLGMILQLLKFFNLPQLLFFCQLQVEQDFLQKVFFAGFIERMGVFYATTIRLWASVTTPAAYVLCIEQAVCRAFDKGNAMGSGTA